MFPQFWSHLSSFTQWLLAAMEILFVTLAGYHVLLRQRDPRAASFWAVIIIFVPLLGAVFYGIFGINRLHRDARKFRGAGARKKAVHEAAPPASWEKNPDLPELRRLAATLSRISRYEFALGNRVEVYHCGDEAMPSMVEAGRAR